MAQLKVLTFRLGDTLWGINILQVRENIQNVKPTEVPLTQPYVAGLINLRGQIVTVIDLGVRLGHRASVDYETIGEKFCIILDTDQELANYEELADPALPIVYVGMDPLGLLTDEVRDVVTFDSSEIKSPPAKGENVAEEFIHGVVTLEDELLLLLDLEKVLDQDF